MSMIKYRVHEVAKDFGVASKVISQILTDYIAPPKNHMQVLENHELDVIFEYMTQHNQVTSLEEIFKVESPVSAPKAEEKPAEKAAAKQARKEARKARRAERQAAHQARQDEIDAAKLQKYIERYQKKKERHEGRKQKSVPAGERPPGVEAGGELPAAAESGPEAA